MRRRARLPVEGILVRGLSWLRTFTKRHALWAGLLAALIPLSILVVVQYRWLRRLEATSTVAHRAALQSCIEEFVAEVERRYGSAAERALDVPSAIFRGDRLDRAAEFFARVDHEGVKTFFVLRFDGEDERGTLMFFDGARTRMVVPETSAQSRAALLASSHWRLFNSKAIPLDAVEIAADEREADNRMLVAPVTDLASQVVGVAGMILDEGYFRQTLAPQVLERCLAKYFTSGDRDRLALSILDGQGGLVYAVGRHRVLTDEVAMPMSLLFKDYRITGGSPERTPEQWSRAGFALNVGLLGVLALVILAGVAVALHTAARAMVLSEMKADFVSNVSHELRTPLASIRVFGELLRLGRVVDPDKVREYGAYIENESRRLTQLINNILDFSRIESGRKSYRLEEVRLDLLAPQIAGSYEVPARQRGVTLRADIRSVPPVLGDADALAQALHNLLDNAVKYSAEGRSVVLTTEAGGGQVRVSVRDEGPGIAKEEQSKIFERFHRVGTGLVHEVRGSGLGLAIVKHVMDAHGGRASVESEPGRGSCFTLSIPAAPATRDGQHASEAEEGVLTPQEERA